jgi:hypothetical protein
VIRIGPKKAQHVAKLLHPNAKIAVRGDGIETRHGRVVHAEEVGSNVHELHPIEDAKQKLKQVQSPGTTRRTPGHADNKQLADHIEAGYV